MSKGFGLVVLGMIVGPIIWEFSGLILGAIGLITVAVVGSTFFEELKKLEENENE